MPDITLCKSEGCPLSETCYRKQAIPDKLMQSYSHFLKEDGTCNHYWKTSNKKNNEKP